MVDGCVVCLARGDFTPTCGRQRRRAALQPRRARKPYHAPIKPPEGPERSRPRELAGSGGLFRPPRPSQPPSWPSPSLASPAGSSSRESSSVHPVEQGQASIRKPLCIGTYSSGGVPHIVHRSWMQNRPHTASSGTLQNARVSTGRRSSGNQHSRSVAALFYPEATRPISTSAMTTPVLSNPGLRPKVSPTSTVMRPRRRALSPTCCFYGYRTAESELRASRPALVSFSKRACVSGYTSSS